jgi:isoleucyl-tRNA synthetase
MKQISGVINQFGQTEISELEKTGRFELEIGEEKVNLSLEDVEIQTEDIPGLTVASEGQLTIALDINISSELKEEGIAREFINKIQNIRKDNDFEVTDRINLTIGTNEEFDKAIINHKDYICTQTLANELNLVENLNNSDAKEVEIDKELFARILVERVN